jgi:MurNAc alpha-1-phosphate uridylyltransferase
MKSRAPLAIRPHVEVEMPQTAMVLAAGLGKRMRPLTATRPKPLVEVAGRTLLDRALDGVERAGIATAVVNAHYFADQIDAAVRARRGPLAIRVSDERAQLLETAGGIIKALPLIDADPFFVVNADNMWIDGSADTLRSLARHWDSETMDALLLLVPLARANGYDGRGDFHLDPGGVVTPKGEFRIAPFVYSGIQLISKRLFDDAPSGPLSMWHAWNKGFAQGRVHGAVHQGLWFHVGTPASVGETEALLATA